MSVYLLARRARCGHAEHVLVSHQGYDCNRAVIKDKMSVSCISVRRCLQINCTGTTSYPGCQAASESVSFTFYYRKPSSGKVRGQSSCMS